MSDEQLECDCPDSGYCPRYKRSMVGKMHEFCQGIGIDPQAAKRLHLALLETANRLEEKPPGLLRKAVSLGKAVVQQAVAGFPVVSQDELDRRLSICKECDKFDQAKGTCTICGCAMKKKGKWLTQHCPLPAPKW